MKNSNFIFGIIFLFFAVYIANAKDQSPISLISASNNFSKIQFESPSLEFIEVETLNGISVISLMQGASPILREGAPVEAIFESVNSSGNLIVVKDYQGLVYLPNWNYNGLGNIFPGKAYHVKTNNEDFLHYLSNSESY